MSMFLKLHWAGQRKTKPSKIIALLSSTGETDGHGSGQQRTPRTGHERLCWGVYFVRMQSGKQVTFQGGEEESPLLKNERGLSGRMASFCMGLDTEMHPSPTSSVALRSGETTLVFSASWRLRLQNPQRLPVNSFTILCPFTAMITVRNIYYAGHLRVLQHLALAGLRAMAS